MLLSCYMPATKEPRVWSMHVHACTACGYVACCHLLVTWHYLIHVHVEALVASTVLAGHMSVEAHIAST